MENQKKVSQTQEKEIVSILGGDIIVTKLDNIFLMVSKTGIKSETSIIPDLDLQTNPATKEDLFNMISSINPGSLDWKSINIKDQLNTSFVLES